MSPPLGHYRDSCGNFKLITKPICVNCRKTEDEIVLENKLAENINLLRDEKNSRERLMRQNESLTRQYVAEKQQLAAAKAELAELNKQKPSYKKEFDCMYEKFKAEEQLSTHYKAELAAEREKVKNITQKLIFAETMFRMPHNVATDTGITFKIATMQEFNRAEMYKEKLVQAEAQNKRIQTAINRYVIGNIELLDAMKAALEGQ